MNNTDTTPVRAGVFGVGSLGQHHARIYAERPECELVGVYDSDADRAAEIAGRHGCRAFDSIEALAKEIEAASVVVPTHLHLDVFRQLEPFNLHLLMEKPIAMTPDEAQEMVTSSQQRGRLLQVGHVERFNPVMQFLEDHLSHPRFIEAIRLAPYPPPRPDAAPRGTEVSVVLDLMIHDLDIILHLVRAELVDVRAVGVPVLSNSEDIANVRLEFAGGCVANITASRISQDRMRKIRVFQEDTYVSLDYMNQAGQLCRKTAEGISAEAVPIMKGEPLAEEIRSFCECVKTARTPVVTGEHGMRALELAIRICRQMTDVEQTW